MQKQTKEITVYISNDDKEFSSEKDCLLWEKHLVLEGLHKRLLQCNFQNRCKIVPYFYTGGVEIKFIGNFGIFDDPKKLDKNNSYCLYGYDRVRYKLRGSKIIMLRYPTDYTPDKQTYVCTIPTKWMDLPMEELSKEVEKFLLNRKVFKKVTTYCASHKFEEI